MKKSFKLIVHSTSRDVVDVFDVQSDFLPEIGQTLTLSNDDESFYEVESINHLLDIKTGELITNVYVFETW